MLQKILSFTGPNEPSDDDEDALLRARCMSMLLSAQPPPKLERTFPISSLRQRR